MQPRNPVPGMALRRLDSAGGSKNIVKILALDNTESHLQMKYSVYINFNVEVNKVAEFGSLDEAKAYCAENTEGRCEVCAEDNCYIGRSNNFKYEVYEGEDCGIYDEEGNVIDLKQPVYETELFYFD